ncbi:MAG TPA: hypothetical protein VGI97_03090 [Gemmatimonadaceae bacterium]|jgi:hypothetical protein
MSHHAGITFSSTCARALTLVATLLVATAAFARPVAAQDSSAVPPTASAADSARPSGAPGSVWNAQRIRRVLGDGTHVMLTDGTVWEVYLPDRPSVDTWKPGDLLVVREAAVMQGEYDYTMKDGRTRKLVWARLVGDVGSRNGS